MYKRKEKIIIIALIVAIIAVGGALGISVYREKAAQSNPETTAAAEQTTSISGAEVDEILKQQMMYVSGIQYFYQATSPNFKHDAMGATVFNNSDVSAKSFVVAFCAFDAEGKPIKIVQPDEQGEGGYLRTITYDYTKAQGSKAALEPKETCEDVLMYVKNEPQIVTVKACVKSYISTNDITWENPYYQTFLQIYSGRELKQ